LLSISLYGQEVKKPELLVNMGYYIINNNSQYIQVKSQIKAQNKLQAVKDISFLIYLDSIAAEDLIAKIKTNEKGIAKAGIPISLKDKWTSATMHTFIAVTQATANEEASNTELKVSRAKLLLDTTNADGIRTINVQVLSFINNEWVPTKGVEIKIGIRRLGGELKIDDKESYTTDSTGMVNAEFKLDSLPGNDAKGNITVVAKIDDNDQLGNLSIEKTVPWGKYYNRVSTLGQRSLWGTRMHSPIWLLIMAYTIITIVWSVIIYLIILLIKIKQLGKEKAVNSDKSIHPSEVLLAD
jgi:hypothetical protein